MTVRVLIVDDQEPFRMAARMVVEATDGFDVVGEAETGEDSVAMAARARTRPGADGREPPRHQRAGRDATDPGRGERRRVVVVLLLSTYEEEEYAPRAAECGAAAYIPKAVFGPDRLEAAWARRDRRRLTAAPARRSIASCRGPSARSCPCRTGSRGSSGAPASRTARCSLPPTG